MPILLFDGVCNLCNGLVQFILRQERRADLRFAALQSFQGQELLRKFNLPVPDGEAPATLVLIEGDRVYVRSEAALRLAPYLQAPWRLLAVLRLLPLALRDALYNWVARNRYALWGRKAECPLPDPSVRARFL